MKLVPVCDFTFMDYDGPMREGEEKAPARVTLTCINHQFLRWSTKNPYQRGIHYLGPVEGTEVTPTTAGYRYQECGCSFHDLRVIVDE
jgi:hypothetical protein